MSNPKPSGEGDEWDSDPTFINNMSERDQRWGNQKTIVDDLKIENQDMKQFRQNVISNAEKKSKENWRIESNAVKNSYMNPTNIK